MNFYEWFHDKNQFYFLIDFKKKHYYGWTIGRDGRNRLEFVENYYVHPSHFGDHYHVCDKEPVLTKERKRKMIKDLFGVI